MNSGPAGAPTVRDLLSSMTALQALSMVMTDGRSEDEILELAASALPSLSRHCRAEAIWFDGGWRSVSSLNGRLAPRGDLQAEIAALGSAGGSLASLERGWAWAFPLSSRDGASGYLVVGAPTAPAIHEWSLMQGLAQQTGMALANARLLARERATRDRIAAEQATLRRVAALVARPASPEEVFTALASEATRLLDADVAVVSRYEEDGSAIVVGAWTADGGPAPLPVGSRVESRGRSVHSFVFESGEPARIDAYGENAEIARRAGLRSVVGAPIRIEGRLYGVIGVAARREEPLPVGAEEWLAGFTELVATAVANAQARVELRGIAEEQAALRRVATLVARAAPPGDVFALVAAEVGHLLGVEFAILSRYEPEGVAVIVGEWARDNPRRPFAVGTRAELTGRSVQTLVFETGRPARIDDYRDASGPAANVARQLRFGSAVGAPISVEGRLWGLITVASSSAEPLPADTEARLAAFTALAGTAVANAEAQSALTASRARIVAAADSARRRIERDLHDGAQQRLASLVLQMRLAQASVPPGAGELAAQLEDLADGLAAALDEVRETARGIHPAVLARGGLRPALTSLANRSAVPVRIDVRIERRLPPAVELAAYYVVAEALTNVTKHADATSVDVDVAERDKVLHVCVSDDGRGGADFARGSGLVGLIDRVEALGGQMSLDSPPGAGTNLEIVLPCP